MAIKQKIAYESLWQGKSIQELFFCAIENTVEKFYAKDFHFNDEVADLIKYRKTDSLRNVIKRLQDIKS